jgi:hypothetical protein
MQELGRLQAGHRKLYRFWADHEVSRLKHNELCG